MEKQRIVKATCCAALLSCATLAQQTGTTSKPTIYVVQRPPNAVPKGSCTFGESGLLQNSDGHNHFTARTPAEVSDYITDRMKKGFVVTLYPQPDGIIFVIATCGDSYATKS
jgi:hypothetical protein